MNTEPGGYEPKTRKARWIRNSWIAFFGVGTFAAGLGFAYKIHQFTGDMLEQEGLQFAGAHLLTYAMVAAGFAALLAFAFLSGQFSDIEKAKYDLLEKEREHDRREFA